MTPDEIEADYYAHYYFDNPNAAKADEDEDFDLDQILQEMEDDDN